MNNVDYESTSGLSDDRLVGAYDYEYDSLSPNGRAIPDTMPVTVWLVRGEDDDGTAWWSWHEDCDGGSSDFGDDFRTLEDARSDALRHLAKMSA